MSEPTISAQLDAVDTAVALADGWGDAQHLQRVEAAAARARERLGLGLDHTIVAIGGPTGAGKSTLFNALVGETVSATSVRRPTTGESHAAVWGDGTDAILDWLDIRKRHRGPDNADRAGLVLVDLPDHDSTVEANRAEVDRLVELVDLFVWVVDPQKYADQSFHEGYIRRLNRHADVMVFVLSKTDLVSPADVDACRDDLRRRLRDDGIDEPRIVAVSVANDGAGEIDTLILDAVSQRRAAVDRVRADLVDAVSGLVSDAAPDDRIAKGARTRFVDAVGAAASIDEAARVGARHHRHRARAAIGWPVLAPIRRLRKPPATNWAPPSVSGVASAEIDRGLRALADAVGGTGDEAWRRTVRHTLAERRDPVLARLDEVVGQSTVSARDRRWWRAAQVIQRLVLTVAAIGAVWMVVMVLADTAFRIDIDSITPTTPRADWLPLPTALMLGGLALGWLLGLVFGGIARVGSRRVERRARSTLRQAASRIADDAVIEPLQDLMERRSEVGRVLAASGLAS